jgi:hypothetical protein
MAQLWKFSVLPSAFLTLVTWLFFKYSTATADAPLTVAETAFVFGVWFALTLITRWIWRRFSKKPEGESPHETPQP